MSDFENLTKDELKEAISEGVNRAFYELLNPEAEPRDRYDFIFQPDKFYEAIGRGIGEAFDRQIYSGTQMPATDFYDFVKEGVKEAVSMMDIESIVKDVIGEHMTVLAKEVVIYKQESEEKS